MTARFVALVAGVGFFFLALVTQGVLPYFEPSATTNHVTAVIRNDIGQLKWMETSATDYTPLQSTGRRIYLREGCWYCHSQYVRPVTGETRRWGPVSEAGEYAYDVPHLFGTRRIGPDLTREGLKYGDEWHLAHFWNPRMLTPDSVMDPYSALFDAPSQSVQIVTDSNSDSTLEHSAVTGKLFDFNSKEQVKLTPNADGVMFVPISAQHKYPLVFTPNHEYAGTSVKLVIETPEVEALIAYVQKLGMNRGKWRDLFEPQEMEGAGISMPRSAAWIEHGKEVYERRCVGCHGVKGDGNGPAATFMYKQRPRNFTQGVFKFRLTEGSLPTDGDMLRTITRGVRGTAMPPWYDLPLNDRLAVIQYIKYELAVDRTNPARPVPFFDQSPGEPLYIPPPPPPTTGMIAHGKDIWVQAKCWECHGEKGKGDGEKAAGLTDDPGFNIRPANLTGGQFKSGASVTDIFRTISTGLNGTPMPSFRDAFPDADRWALSYYILSLSAFTDAITGDPLTLSAVDREALNNPKLQTPGPEQAYGLLPP